MRLHLVDRRIGADGTSAEFHGAAWERLERLAAAVGRPEWDVDVVLVDDDMMTDLNRRYRDRDSVTDVLSFSYLEDGGDGEPALAAGEAGAAVDLWRPAPDEGGAVGELVLAPAFIAARCAENGWPLAEEIPMLAVHGSLHLLGWDHRDEDETGAMQDLEATILAGEGLPHPLRRRS